MTAISKIKYVIASIILIVLCVLTTAFTLKFKTYHSEVIVIDLTYGLLLLAAFLIGGVATGISSVLGVCLYILISNKSPWLALLGLIVGLTFGIITKLGSYLNDEKKLDKKALFISAGAFYIALGVVFTVARASFGKMGYITENSVFIRFFWPEIVLPYILGVIFIAAAIVTDKLQENVNEMLITGSFASTSVIVIYSIFAFLCSIKKHTTFKQILANTYTKYLSNFLSSAFFGFLIAIVLYILGYIAIRIRKMLKDKLNDAE